MDKSGIGYGFGGGCSWRLSSDGLSDGRLSVAEASAVADFVHCGHSYGHADSGSADCLVDRNSHPEIIGSSFEGHPSVHKFFNNRKE